MEGERSDIHVLECLVVQPTEVENVHASLAATRRQDRLDRR